MSVFDAVDLSSGEIAGRLGLALGLGAVIGLQREVDGHDAGVRTHALLTLGSALFGLLSVGAFGDFVATRADSNVQVDVTRIASYLVAGVGFVAGGSIMKSRGRVRGLTTAASLWVAAGVGLAAGLGFIFGAIVVAAATLVVLLLEGPISKLVRTSERVTVRVVVREGRTLSTLIDTVEGCGKPRSISSARQPDGRTAVTIRGLPADSYRAVVAELEQWPEVTELSFRHD